MGITHLPYPQMFGTIDYSKVEPKAQAAFPLACSQGWEVVLPTAMKKFEETRIVGD